MKHVRLSTIDRLKALADVVALVTESLQQKPLSEETINGAVYILEHVEQAIREVGERAEQKRKGTEDRQPDQEPKEASR
jgi:hypothetical protein